MRLAWNAASIFSRLVPQSLLEYSSPMPVSLVNLSFHWTKYSSSLAVPPNFQTTMVGLPAWAAAIWAVGVGATVGTTGFGAESAGFAASAGLAASATGAAGFAASAGLAGSAAGFGAAGKSEPQAVSSAAPTTSIPDRTS